MLFIPKHVQAMQASEMLDRAKIILLLEIKTFFKRKLVSREGNKASMRSEASPHSYRCFFLTVQTRKKQWKLK